ncbi:hypothetical protein [Actinoplanes subtropicus]|uniref:hypothetical protein n=1 Tax=Actinoplanes subtropicus TaxID=543632 RepID=UPI0004C41EB5|nr:hypothetical protein [Actinoplanes subtropicus]
MLIFRRWKIALPLLLLSIGATAYVALTAKPDYKMTSYVQFVPAKVTGTDNAANAAARNPWNQLGTNTLGQAVIYATQDQGFLDSLKAGKHTDNFTLTLTYPNPIITVEVVGTTADDARTTTDLIINRMKSSADALQRSSGATDADLITTQRLDRGANVAPSNSKMKRAVIAVGAAGLVLTAGGTVGFDAIMRRRARKQQELANGAVAGAGDDPKKAGVNGADKGSMDDTRLITLMGNKRNGREVPAMREPMPESVERTAIIIKRNPPVEKPPVKPARPASAGTYRSANAQTPTNGQAPANGDDRKPNPADPNNNKGNESSDVRVVLQPKWVGGENGNKPK